MLKFYLYDHVYYCAKARKGARVFVIFKQTLSNTLIFFKKILLSFHSSQTHIIQFPFFSWFYRKWVCVCVGGPARIKYKI